MTQDIQGRFSALRPTARATAGRWEHFPHGADVGIRGIGPTIDIAFAEAALALTAVLVDPATVAPTQAVEIRCSGEDREDLLYAWLNAVVYEMAIRRMLFGNVEVKIDGIELFAILRGEPVSPGRHSPAVEVKGATYTALSVRRVGDEWIAECVVDV